MAPARRHPTGTTRKGVVSSTLQYRKRSFGAHLRNVSRQAIALTFVGSFLAGCGGGGGGSTDPIPGPDPATGAVPTDAQTTPDGSPNAMGDRPASNDQGSDLDDDTLSARRSRERVHPRRAR